MRKSESEDEARDERFRHDVGVCAQVGAGQVVSRLGVGWTVRSATHDDGEWMADLRAVVMRADLERVGVFDPVWVRQRFLNAYAPQHTRVIVVDGEDVGLVAVRPDADGVWIEHFYVATSMQGRGIGSAVLDDILATPCGELPFRLNVLHGSAARALYDRRGFVVESEDAVDVFMVRPSQGRTLA